MGREAEEKEKEEEMKYYVYCDLGPSLNAMHTLPHLIRIIPLRAGPIIIFILQPKKRGYGKGGLAGWCVAGLGCAPV